MYNGLNYFETGAYGADRSNIFGTSRQRSPYSYSVDALHPAVEGRLLSMLASKEFSTACFNSRKGVK